MKGKKITLEFTAKELEALTYWIFLGEVTYSLNKKQNPDNYNLPDFYPKNVKIIRERIFSEMHKQKMCDGKKVRCKSKKCPYEKN